MDPELTKLRAQLSALGDSEALLAALFAHAPVAFQIYRADGRSLLVNDAFRRMFGSEPPPDYNVFQDEVTERSGLQGLIRRAFQGEVIQTPPVWYDPRELEHVQVSQGRRVAMEVTLFPLRTADGVVTHVAVTAKDRTAELLAQARLEAEQQKLLAEAGRVLSSSLDPGRMLADIARLLVSEVALVAAIDLLDAQGHLGGSLVVLHREPERTAGAEATYRQSVAQGDAEHPARLAAASGLTCQLAFEPGAADPLGLGALGLRSALWVPLVSRGRVLGVLFVGSSDRPYDEIDRTAVEELGRRAASVIDNARLFELAQAERQRAEEASLAKDEFLAVVSHELRTPLQAILGWARLMQTGALSADQQQQALRTVERNARAQTQLIEDLLDVSRIITGKLRLSVGAVDLPHVIEGAIDAIRPAADAKGQKLSLLIEPGLDPLPGDPERLQQVVWNLLSNAVRYTPRGGQIHTTLRRADGWVEVTIRDTGEGISADFLPHVFERFRQADSGTTRRHGGLGLGLSISKHLVELHGGTIEARSDGPGQGASFTVRLPTALPHAEAEPAREPPRELASGPASGALAYPPALRGLRVLVVDDEDDARELLRSVLHHGQAEVYTAASAEEALAMVEQLRPDVLVSDIGMPGQDGYALLRSVRSLPPERGGRTPAIALTAYARAEDRTRALGAGFQRHLAKPVEPQVLIRALLSLLHEPAG